MDGLIFKIAAVGVISALLAVTLRRDNPVFAVLIGLAGGVLVFFMAAPRFGAALDMIKSVADSLGDGAAYISTVLKIIGIAYAAEFGASICSDAGEAGLASRVELAGKALILAASAPVVLTLLRQILSVI
jgi:stage III sporulation protein AD